MVAPSVLGDSPGVGGGREEGGRGVGAPEEGVGLESAQPLGWGNSAEEKAMLSFSFPTGIDHEWEEELERREAAERCGGWEVGGWGRGEQAVRKGGEARDRWKGGRVGAGV